MLSSTHQSGTDIQISILLLSDPLRLQLHQTSFDVPSAATFDVHCASIELGVGQNAHNDSRNIFGCVSWESSLFPRGYDLACQPSPVV